MSQPAPLLTARDVCAELVVSHSTLYAWIERGILPQPLKFGQRSRWRRSDIDAVIARSESERGKQRGKGNGGSGVFLAGSGS